MSAHSIAEVYAALTRLPVQPRIHPVEAVRIITDNILPHFEAVTVGKRITSRRSGSLEMGMERSEDLRRVADELRGQAQC